MENLHDRNTGAGGVEESVQPRMRAGGRGLRRRNASCGSHGTRPNQKVAGPGTRPSLARQLLV